MYSEIVSPGINSPARIGSQIRQASKAATQRKAKGRSEVNKLFYGNNLGILRDKERMPSESVDLCYIDPPFNSQRNYNQIYDTPKKVDAAQAQAFTDTWTWDTTASLGFQEIVNNEGGRFQADTIELLRGLSHVIKGSSLLAYLVSMTLRLIEIHRVLKPTGSFYLHCDPTASHYLKLVLDSIFGVENYRNEIVWKRKAGRGETNNAAIRFGVSTDTILFYSKSTATPFNRQYRESNPHYIATKFTHKDENGRRYHLDNITSPSPRPNLRYVYKGYEPPANG
jgi:site-specific DNA-methyltransferase (adenine-specific)